MQPIPEDILLQFNAVLEQKAVSATLRDDYRKWLRYYLDFRVKYPLPDAKSEQVRLFIEKMRSKGKFGKSLHHAVHAHQGSRQPTGFLSYTRDLSSCETI